MRAPRGLMARFASRAPGWLAPGGKRPCRGSSDLVRGFARCVEVDSHPGPPNRRVAGPWQAGHCRHLPEHGGARRGTGLVGECTAASKAEPTAGAKLSDGAPGRGEQRAGRGAGRRPVPETAGLSTAGLSTAGLTTAGLTTAGRTFTDLDLRTLLAQVLAELLARSNGRAADELAVREERREHAARHDGEGFAVAKRELDDGVGGLVWMQPDDQCALPPRSRRRLRPPRREAAPGNARRASGGRRGRYRARQQNRREGPHASMPGTRLTQWHRESARAGAQRAPMDATGERCGGRVRLWSHDRPGSRSGSARDRSRRRKGCGSAAPLAPPAALPRQRRSPRRPGATRGRLG